MKVSVIFYMCLMRHILFPTFSSSLLGPHFLLCFALLFPLQAKLEVRAGTLEIPKA